MTIGFTAAWSRSLSRNEPRLVDSAPLGPEVSNRTPPLSPTAPAQLAEGLACLWWYDLLICVRLPFFFQACSECFGWVGRFFFRNGRVPTFEEILCTIHKVIHNSFMPVLYARSIQYHSFFIDFRSKTDISCPSAWSRSADPRKVKPLVQEICQRHGIEYRSSSFSKALVEVPGLVIWAW